MKFSRLTRMSSPEIAHRLREQYRRQSDRFRFRGGVGHDEDPELDALANLDGHARGSLKTYFQDGPTHRFYSSIENRDATVSFIDHWHPEWLDKIIEESAAICAHRVNFLSYRNIPLGASINWHRDPISGFDWPRRYYADYDLLHAPPADAKVIHELNRHQHLPRLAKAFFVTGDEAYAREAIAQIESWIDQNPKWLGVNWQSSLELAIRCISWLWTIFLLLPSESLDESRLRRICRSLFAQLDHVYRYPSVYTSPNTHLMGEAAALFIAGVLFPELPRANNWRDFGAATLIDEMQKQVSSDGVYGELSSYYHCYAADFYLHVLALARRNRIQLPETVWNGLSGMLDFVVYLTRPDGTIPLFGDDDGGRVLALDALDYTSFRDGLSTGSVLFGRPDYKFQARGFREESLWLLGADAWPMFDSLAAQPPSEPCRAFAGSGYFIQRSGWGAHDTHVTFDCGGLGIGSGGHSHADALSLTVFSGGHEFLIDPGTSVYNCAREWRRYFRSTAAHNTVVIDGKDQSEPGDTFRWKTKTPGRLRTHLPLTESDYIDADTGTTSARGVVPHRRRIVHIKPNYWIVLDAFDGTGEHDFDFFYHFASKAQLAVMSDEKRGEVECRARIEDAGLQLCMFGSDAVSAEVLCGQINPIQGWASAGYGDRHASPVLKALMRAKAPAAMMSFLVPGRQSIRARRFKANSSHTIAATIRDGEYDDIAVVAVEDGDMQLLDYEMRGEFFWLRTENSSLHRLLAVNAYSFRYRGETIFESSEMIPYVQAYFWDNGILIERGDDERKVYVRDLRDRQLQHG